MWQAELPDGTLIGPVPGQANLREQVRAYVGKQRIPNGTQVYRIEEEDDSIEFYAPYSVVENGHAFNVVDSAGAVRAVETHHALAKRKANRWNED